MSTLQNKIDFIALVSVTNANPNGDPLNGNRPRSDYNGYGEITAECIKRKIRNRMQDLGNNIFVQMESRSDDGCESLSERAADLAKECEGNREAFIENACEKWLDVRSFGQVFAYKDLKGTSIGVRGPVSIHQVVSVSPIEIESVQITKSVNGDRTKGGKKSPDTMGMKHIVRFGLYKIKGSINVQLAEKTGFTEKDADTLKECLRTLFENDASAARPEGSMEVVKLYWFRHYNKAGQYSSAKIHRTLKITQRDESAIPTSIDDYSIELNELPGLDVEVIEDM